MSIVNKIISTLLLTTLCGAVVPSQAQPAGAPVYARQRAGIVSEREYPVSFRRGFGRFFPLQTTFVAGNWYTRPYPYHLDYRLLRPNVTATSSHYQIAPEKSIAPHSAVQPEIIYEQPVVQPVEPLLVPHVLTP